GLDRVEDGDLGDRPAVLLYLSVELEKAPAHVVLRKGRDAELPGERDGPILRRADPLSADVDGRAAERDRVAAATHPIARLQHDPACSRVVELPRGGEPGEPRPRDRHDIPVNPFRHATHLNSRRLL